jgi:hypothetical protein
VERSIQRCLSVIAPLIKGLNKGQILTRDDGAGTARARCDELQIRAKNRGAQSSESWTPLALPIFLSRWKRQGESRKETSRQKRAMPVGRPPWPGRQHWVEVSLPALLLA